MSDLSAEEMIEIWALRSVGGSLTDPTTPATRGRRGVDREASIALYVTLAPGFKSALPALRWVYIMGKPATEFRTKLAGESYLNSLVRLGWGEHNSKAPPCVCDAVVNNFIEALEGHMAGQPWHDPSVEQEKVGAEIADELNDEPVESPVW